MRHLTLTLLSAGVAAAISGAALAGGHVLYPTYDPGADNGYPSKSRGLPHLYPRYDQSADNGYTDKGGRGYIAAKPLPRRYPTYDTSQDNQYPWQRPAPSAAQIDRPRPPRFYPMYDARGDNPYAPQGYIAIPKRRIDAPEYRKSDAYDRFFDE